MNNSQKWYFQESIFAVAAIVFMLFLHGAVPFLMTPTLGQAVWTTGFAQSFTHGPWYGIYAQDFGMPKPAAIAFGLAGAWPTSLLIRLGLHPADAYSGIVAFWLIVAFFSAYKIAKTFGATRSIALLGSTVWISMPVIWGHAGYSMVSLGIGLFSFYFLAALKLFLAMPKTSKITVSTIAFYFLATFIAVFMDGYTVRMFASGASVIFIFTLISRPELRPMLWRISLPVHIISFALAYILFSTFIGKASFDKHPIDFFRGWGLDLSFVAIPTRGIHWLPDWLGISVPRNAGMYFCDASVWITTFSLPIILAGLLAWWLAKKQLKIATGILLIAIFGFYMALGPSLKINSTKPESLQMSHPGQLSALMPATFAVMPTGNAWISKILPGFNVMRASYRWSALGIFAFWLLVMIYMARTDKIGKTLWMFVLLGLIILNLPNLPRHWQHNIKTRIQFNQIDQDLVTVLRQQIKPGEIVAFLPWGNDFFANYLAPRAGFRTFNIGGDKNLQEAMTQWPTEMKALKKELDLKKASSALKMLIDGTADVLVVPYFNMLWAAHSWPTTIKKDIRLSPFFGTLSNSSILSITDTDFFATIRLRPEFIGNENREKLTRTALNEIDYPMILSPNLKYSTFVLVQGWHTLEAHYVWSQANAKLTLPVPKECDERQCFAVLKFGVYSASPQRAVAVNFESVGANWNKKIISTSGSLQELMIPLNSQSGRQDISISIPDATSPKALGKSSDPRILGIALQRVDLIF